MTSFLKLTSSCLAIYPNVEHPVGHLLGHLLGHLVKSLALDQTLVHPLHYPLCTNHWIEFVIYPSTPTIKWLPLAQLQHASVTPLPSALQSALLPYTLILSCRSGHPSYLSITFIKPSALVILLPFSSLPSYIETCDPIAIPKKVALHESRESWGLEAIVWGHLCSFSFSKFLKHSRRKIEDNIVFTNDDWSNESQSIRSRRRKLEEEGGHMD
jgi:hypothetical protein